MAVCAVRSGGRRGQPAEVTRRCSGPDSPVPDIPNPKWKPIKVPTRSRKGKPHVVTEMRTQASKFTAFARAQFSFAGTVYMLYAMGANQTTAAAYNRALKWALKQGKIIRK